MRHFLALGMVLFSIACSRGGNSNWDFVTDLNISFDDAFSKGQVTCESNCPQNVGLIVLKKADGYFSSSIAQCSGTLVGNRIVATNSHCIPDEVKSGSGNCGESLGFILPSAQVAGLSRSRCKKLIFASDIGYKTIDRPDYAFFELDADLTDSPVRFNNNGFADGKNFYAYVVDPVQNPRQVQGLIRKKDCIAVQNSIIAQSFTNDLAPMVSLFGQSCEVIGGNSGSGIYAEGENTIRGVISHGRKKGDSGESAAIAKYNLADKLGLGANFACVSQPEVGLAKNSGCGGGGSRLKLGESLQLSFRESLVNRAPDIIRSLPKFFRYQVRFALDRRLTGTEYIQLQVTPLCLKHEAYWDQAERIANYNESTRTINVLAQLYGIEMRGQYDQFSKLQMTFTSFQNGTLRLNHSIDQLPKCLANTSEPFDAGQLRRAAENYSSDLIESEMREFKN